PDSAEVQTRRTAPGIQRPARRDELHRASPRAALLRRDASQRNSLLRPPPLRKTRSHRLGASDVLVWSVYRGCVQKDAIRSLLRKTPVALDGHSDSLQNRKGRSFRPRAVDRITECGKPGSRKNSSTLFKIGRA